MLTAWSVLSVAMGFDDAPRRAPAVTSARPMAMSQALDAMAVTADARTAKADLDAVPPAPASTAGRTQTASLKRGPQASSALPIAGPALAQLDDALAGPALAR